MSALRRRRRLRRLSITLAIVSALLAAVVLAVSWSLPWLVARTFASGAETLQAEEARIAVPHASLSRLGIADLHVQRGGLQVDLAGMEAEYSVLEAIAGRIKRVDIRGLAIELDFTQPRRGLLPDAIEEILSQFGGGGELVWPVDELTFSEGRIVFVLPGGRHELKLQGSARRTPDGQVAARIDLAGSGQELALDMVIRTETLDGTVSLERLVLEPNILLAAATELGLMPQTPDSSVAAPRIEMSGTATLRDGTPTAYDLRAGAPAITVAFGSTTARAELLEIEAHKTADRPAHATATARVSAADVAEAWTLADRDLRVTLDGGALRAESPPAEIAYGTVGHAHLGLTIESGIPALGGEPAARVAMTVADAIAGGRSFDPITVVFEGWTDAARMSVAAVRMHDIPLVLAQFHAEVRDPLGEKPRVSGGAAIRQAFSEDQFAGLGLSREGLPDELARVTFALDLAADAPTGSLALSSTLPRITYDLDGERLEADASLALDLQASGTGASAVLGVDLERIQATGTKLGPLPDHIGIRATLPVTPLATLLAWPDPTPDAKLDGSVTVRATGNDLDAHATLDVTRVPGGGGWAASAAVVVERLAGTWAGTKVEQASGNLAASTGTISDELLERVNAPGGLAELLRSVARTVDLRATARANAIEQPGTARLEWCDLRLDKPASHSESGDLQASLALNAGIMRAGPEVVEQAKVTAEVAGSLEALTVQAQVEGLLEGSPLRFTTRQDVRLDPITFAPDANGTFTLAPFALAYSDVLDRWAPEAAGLVVSGRLHADGTTRLAADGTWDGTARVALADGLAIQAAQDLRVDGISIDVAIESLANLRTAPGQKVDVSRVTLGDIVVSDAMLRFRTAGPSVVHIEAAGFSVFDGRVTAEPFSLYFPDADVALDLRMRDLDAGALVRTFDLFNGSLTGRLQGRLPIGLLAGRPIIGEGFLELQPEYPARLSFDAGGLFTKGLPNRSMIEKINRLPNELLEEGLANLQLRHFRIDLFKRERPDRPIQILLGGTARTPRADVPLELTVNLFGSMSEVVDMLLQLVLL